MLKSDILIVIEMSGSGVELEMTFEPLHEKTNNSGFQPGQTQIDLYSHRSRLEA